MKPKYYYNAELKVEHIAPEKWYVSIGRYEAYGVTKEEAFITLITEINNEAEDFREKLDYIFKNSPY